LYLKIRHTINIRYDNLNTMYKNIDDKRAYDREWRRKQRAKKKAEAQK
jgi:hypothetical protein